MYSGSVPAKIVLIRCLPSELQLVDIHLYWLAFVLERLKNYGVCLVVYCDLLWGWQLRHALNYREAVDKGTLAGNRFYNITFTHLLYLNHKGITCSSDVGCVQSLSSSGQDAFSTGNTGENRQQTQVSSHGGLYKPSKGRVQYFGNMMIL